MTSEYKSLRILTLSKSIYLGNLWTGDNKNEGKSNLSTTGFS